MPGVQDVGVLDRLVAVVVLGVDAEHRRLDAQVDVLGHQRDARFVVQRLQRERLRRGSRCPRRGPAVSGSARGELARLEEQRGRDGRACLPWLAGELGGQRQARVDLLLGGVAHQLVEEAADLAHVARRFRQALLVRVELLEHHHRQIDVVLLEAEDRGRDRASARSCRARTGGAARRACRACAGARLAARQSDFAASSTSAAWP